MNDSLAGQALYPLADLVEPAAFPLAALLSAQQYSAIFGRFYYSDVNAYLDNDRLNTELVLLYQGILALPIPALSGFELVFNSAAPGWTLLHATLVLDDEPVCMIREATIALRVPEALLQDVSGSMGAQISVTSDVMISHTGLSLVNIAGATLPPARLLGTDIIVQGAGVRPIVAESNDDTGLPSMQGIEFTLLSLQVPLPMLKTADQGVISFDISTGRIDAQGFSGAVVVEAEELLTAISGQYLALPFEFRRFGLDIEQNQFNACFIVIALRLPALAGPDSPNWLTLRLNLDQYNRSILASLDAPLLLNLGRPDFKVELATLTLSGLHSDDGFAAQGTASGNLTLPYTLISLLNTQLELVHSSSNTRFALNVEGLQLGPLGVVDIARLVITISNDEAANSSSIETVTLETILSWQDLRNRIALDQLPAEFPLPPDNATISVFFDWRQDGKVELRLAAALSDIDALWGFIPEQCRPAVRNPCLTLTILYASTDDFQHASSSDQFSGEVSVRMELQLPVLPDIPGAELFEFDQQQWLEATLKGGMRSVNGVNEGYMELGIANAPNVGVNFPGMPQTEPPIQIELKKLNFNLKAQQGNDQVSGQLQLEGAFTLRPINPAQSKLPVPPAMMAHMEKLFKAVGLDTTFAGTASFDLKFKDGKAAVSLAIVFEDARLQMDLFDMVAGAARGMAPPQGMEGAANTIDLDIDVDIRLREIKIQFGSVDDTTTAATSQFGFELGFDATIAGVQVDNFSFKLSNKEFSFGFAELNIPIALPRFPMERKDLDALRTASGAWDYHNNWQLAARPQLVNSISNLKDEIELLKQQLAAGLATDSELRAKRTALFEHSARQFLIDSIFAVHQLVGDSNQQLYQGLVEAYMTLMDATIHQIAFDTKLDFVLSKVRFVLPFHNPSDIRVEGGARLSGFKDDDPLKPLEQLVFGLGLSAEYIYFNVEGGDAIPLPIFGSYQNEAGELEAKVSVQLNHARIGYGYSKNALVVAFAGQLNIAESLVDDLNTADDIGVGIRLPERSRLGFKLDLIPITLGEVNFLLPLLEFDVDLRKEYSPGIVDSATCEPYWDGLQLVAPNIIRSSFKHFRFSPFFGSLLAPNYKLGYDLMLGNADNGITYICDDYLVIVPTSPYTIIPMLADGVPFFNNLCTNIRLAGFSVNFNLQRPFPSMSPLALFEIFGLLADPMMPVDPNGALASTIRATIQHARITLPPAVVRMFPEYGAIVSREINYTINLATLITVTQAVAGPVGKLVKSMQLTTGDATNFLQSVLNDPPEVSPAQVLALLPPELRCIELEGSFMGFAASAAFVLLTPEEAKDAFNLRDNPLADSALRLVYNEPFHNLPPWLFDNEAISGWKQVSPDNRQALWRVQDGELRQTANIDVEAFMVHKKVYQDIEFTVELRSDTKHAIGIVFSYLDDRNYYRMVFYPGENRSELTKVAEGRPTVLFAISKSIATGRRYTVKTRIERITRITREVDLRMQIMVDALPWLDFTEQTSRQTTPFIKGQIGLYCEANPGARFSKMQVHQFGAARHGDFTDPSWLTTYQPNFSRQAVPLYNSADPNNSPLQGNLFADFTAADLPTIESEVSGVLVGAEVKLLQAQVFRFLGYVFTDGTFGLVSSLTIEPLKLSVAGISVQLPLEVQGRLALNGRAHGAKSYAQVSASVWGIWQPLPGIIELKAGSNSKPITLTLHSDGRFALQGSGELQLFAGTAVIAGSVDISQSHCFIEGGFSYQSPQHIANKPIIEVSLASAGRLGPGNSFEVNGKGTLKLLGKSVTNVIGVISDKGLAVEAQFNATNWNWNDIIIRKFTLALQGKIELSEAGFAKFLFEGDIYLRLFADANANNRLEIHGLGGLKSDGANLTTFVEGRLFWQGRDWLQGRLELGTEHISLSGRTAFALDLTPAELPSGIEVANLYFRVELSGGFTLSATSGLKACNLDIDWSLAVKMPGVEQQLPIAMQKKRFEYLAGAGGPQAEVDLLNLVTINSALFIPFGDLQLPIPTVEVDEFTQYYLYWQNITPSTKPIYKKVAIENSNNINDQWRFPTGIGVSSSKTDITSQIANAFNIPYPPPFLPNAPRVEIPKFSGNNWKRISITNEDINLPTIEAPRVSANVPSSVPNSKKSTLFQLPTKFKVSLANDKINLLENMNFSLMLTWKNNKLGVTVKKNNTRKFTSFDKMFNM